MVPLGQVVIMSNALGAFSSDIVHASIARHQIGDWGDVDEEDREANDQALKDGDRILSVCRNGETKFYVIVPPSQTFLAPPSSAAESPCGQAPVHYHRL